MTPPAADATVFTAPSRALDRATRVYADALSDRIRSSGGASRFVATVASVAVGEARDGAAALVVVDWEGSLVPANGYSRSYTPVQGHSVICDLINDQVFIAYSVIGQP